MVYFPACTTLTNTSCHPLSLNYKLCSSLYAIRFSGFHLQLTWPWVNPLCNKIHISNMQYTFPSFEMAVLGCFWCVTWSKETLCSLLQTMEILCFVAGDWMLLQNYDWYAYIFVTKCLLFSFNKFYLVMQTVKAHMSNLLNSFIDEDGCNLQARKIQLVD